MDFFSSPTEKHIGWQIDVIIQVCCKANDMTLSEMTSGAT